MRVGFTASSFDLLHAGHIAMLEESKKNCDYLIVGLNANPLKRGKYPAQGLFERYLQLKAVKYVDEIIPYNSEEELIEIFNTLDIDVRFIGSDYKNQDFTGKDINDRNGTEIFYNRRDHNFSSSGLKQRVVSNQSEPTMNGEVVKDNETYTLIDNTELKDMTTSSTTLKPGQSTRGHSHDGQEEVYIFMSGTGAIDIDDKRKYVKRGDVVNIQKGEFHKVHNFSNEEDLHFIAIFTDRRNH